MTVTLGNYASPTWGGIQEYSGGMTQKALLVTAPSSGRITSLGAWLAGWSGSVTAELVLWDYVTRAVLAHSATFTVAQGGNGDPPHGYRYEYAPTVIPNVAAGQQLLVGFCCTPGSGGYEYPVNASGSGTHYEKKVTSWPGSMSGMASEPYKAGFYAILTPGGFVKVRRSGAWVDAPVYVLRGGAWVPASSVNVRRSGSWQQPS